MCLNTVPLRSQLLVDELPPPQLPTSSLDAGNLQNQAPGKMPRYPLTSPLCHNVCSPPSLPNGLFLRDKAVEARHWPFTCIWYERQECVELYLRPTNVLRRWALCPQPPEHGRQSSDCTLLLKLSWVIPSAVLNVGERECFKLI
jgi:hypothetical protein